MATDSISVGVPAVTDTSTGANPVPRGLRLWPAVTLLALFWLAILATGQLEMSMTARFMTRLAAHALLLLGFLIWWLSRSSLRWGERLQAVLIFVVGSLVVLQIADATISGWTIFLSAMSFVFMAWTAALFFTRNRSATIRRAAVGLAILVVLSPCALVRCDGIDGAQHGEYSWRWSPTSEQLFLASRTPPAAADAAVPATDWQLRPGDVPGFRGTSRDSVVGGTKLALDWTAQPPRQLWRQRLGPGWSSMIVVDGHVVTQEQRDAAEVVACYDAATGQEVWAHSDPVRFYEGLSGAGPRGTPAFADGRIYAIGAKGNLECLEAATGKLLWSHDLVTEAEATVPQWGFAVSPLVADGKVIVFAPGSAEKPSAGIVAYDAQSGSLAWQTGDGGDTYSSPQLVELAGTRQLVMHDSHGLHAVNLADGKVLWQLPSTSAMALPMLQPLAIGPDKLLLVSDNGLTLLSVTLQNGEWSTKELWVSNRIKPGFNDLIVHKGKVYGLDDGILCALDLATGERLWKKGRYGHGQLLLLADQDALLVQGARGEVLLIGIGGDQPEELGQFEAIEGKTWNHPSLVGNRLFVRNGEEIACYELPSQQ
jgi:outer membrane protein assembly factor BamB